MKVLSLFDGIACGRIALERANIIVGAYYSSEIKEYAIKVSKEHYPDIIQLGDVRNIKYKGGVIYSDNGEFKVGDIDLLIGGSPCTDFSILKVTNGDGIKGLKGKYSSLFYEYLRLLKEVKPKYFLLENVKMKKEFASQLTDYLGVEGIHINSALVSFQNRPRIYWTNIPNIDQPLDRNINFQDYKDTDFDYCKQFKLKPTKSRLKMWNDGKGFEKIGTCKNITNSKKVGCLTRKQDRSPNSGLVEFDGFCRFLTRKEIELAQTLPIGYTDCLSYNQMQDVCGDGWTVEVIVHIFNYLKLV
jgi:cytosine-specific methyltransferase|nr:MAG TPA: Cytosine specific methyltransferase [Caudoviricetes sp.]